MRPASFAPLSGAAPYHGGKRKLAGRIVPLLESIPHQLSLAEAMEWLLRPGLVP